jgi:hypothetical protein
MNAELEPESGRGGKTGRARMKAVELSLLRILPSHRRLKREYVAGEVHCDDECTLSSY